MTLHMIDQKHNLGGQGNGLKGSKLKAYYFAFNHPSSIEKSSFDTRTQNSILMQSNGLKGSKLKAYYFAFNHPSSIEKSSFDSRTQNSILMQNNSNH
eukprot:CAMPEP_0202980264 /NCGR_PEP_ID=MMETSP1396-20130829/86217_1 /ASSEMBLY_ACC=CAM_ASM_000872 /TAXON_ID= /ORGANISM="Pseudokeronopsis sp., Strain Brazil" /LENGTH=96 /DNA_ID=CAMNT_0049720121 /DNA_START=163 /DNA_END=453 /DNA_ORIENTATION=-